MSTTVSVSRRSIAPAVRISREALMVTLTVAATITAVIGIAIESDALTYIAATVGLTSIYSLDKKGGVQ